MNARNNNYYWTKDTVGIPILVINVNKLRWTFGGLVLHTLKSNLCNKVPLPLNEIFLLEKQHFSSIEMRSLDEEFKIIQQTPDYKAIYSKYEKECLL